MRSKIFFTGLFTVLIFASAFALLIPTTGQSAATRTISVLVTLNAGDDVPALYAQTPNSVSSAVFSVTAAGIAVPAEKFGDICYVRFVATGSTAITITTPGHVIGDATVSPLDDSRQLSKTGDALSFGITRTGSYMVRIDGLEPLLIFADAPEIGAAPRFGDTRVINLADYLPENRDPFTPVTAAIQRAIDDTAAQVGGQGGTLLIPNGLYVAGQLRLKSNVFLYLSDGALLQSQANFNQTDFPSQANGDSSFIFIENASNVRIGGRGIIDGNGYAVRSGNSSANIKLLRTAGASDVTIEDVFFRDSSRWSLHILDSSRVTLRNFKLVNDLRGAFDPVEGVFIPLVTNTDGVDVDASSNVLVEGAFIYTGDDATALKVTNYMNRKNTCHGVVIRNNTFYVLKCAIRLGDESLMDIHGVDFENNDIIRADRAIALRNGDGCRMYDFRAINNRAEYIGGDYNERFFTFRIWLLRAESRPGRIDSVLIKDFYARKKALQNSDMQGYGTDNKITGVTFNNIVIAGKRATGPADIPLTVKPFADAPAFTQ